jgi:hypothetical protein
MKERDWIVGIALVVALAAGFGTGYLLWGWADQLVCARRHQPSGEP